MNVNEQPTEQEIATRLALIGRWAALAMCIDDKRRNAAQQQDD